MIKNYFSQLRSKIKVTNPWIKPAPVLAGLVSEEQTADLIQTDLEVEPEINDLNNDQGFQTNELDESYSETVAKPTVFGGEETLKVQSSPLSKAKTFLTKLDLKAKLPKFGTRAEGGFAVSRQKLLLICLVVLGLASILGAVLIYYPKGDSNLANKSSTDTRASVQGAKSQQQINQELSFPLRDETGKEVAKIKYFIESAQLRDEILVKGQRATAIQGKTFLILNLKVTNEYSKAVEINTRDYVRFVLGDGNEQMAADIHNDPVIAQADATKLTRIGLTIDDSNLQNIKLLVGEIKGEKQTIDIKF